MNIAESSIDNRIVTLVLTVVMLLGGLSAYRGLSRLEDLVDPIAADKLRSAVEAKHSGFGGSWK